MTKSEKVPSSLLFCAQLKKDIAKQLIQVQEEERKRISRTLHDSVTQDLLGLLVELRVLKYMDDAEEMNKRLQIAERNITNTIAKIKNLSVELRDSNLSNVGIKEALQLHFQWVKKHYGLTIHFQSNIAGNRFSNEIETVIFRICQEAIFNAYKYAGVREIFVELNRANDRIDLKIKDLGKGFNPVEEVMGTGLGITGMEERAAIIGAKLSIFSSIGNGTLVQMKVPLKERGPKS
ncbi:MULTISPECIES: sensor histidine kinase [Lysinibacillus]|uniref:histidine kinase n=1 Tax=Lysinibacillus antri TaxID=2498145 RepID=A0A3S0PP13_9BACI|nr:MULTISPECIES: sensor histidine kinase [Lysinibacillus]RUL51622.1 sensor histidine kinase [Lysinibacillus antri]TSI10663.1 sensor histidine kinase [Lysinibacillus sp. BW-2-10]